MKRTLLAIMLAAAIAGTAPAGTARAQAPAPNPLDNIPEALAANIPYGAPVTAEQARAIIAAGVAEAKKRNWPMNLAVMDSGGNLVMFERMDGAQLVSIAIAQKKALTAVQLRRETKVFEGAVQGGFNYILSIEQIIAARGGIPLVLDGKVIGAVGVSGGSGSQDEVVAKAAAAALK